MNPMLGAGGGRADLITALLGHLVGVPQGQPYQGGQPPQFQGGQPIGQHAPMPGQPMLPIQFQGGQPPQFQPGPFQGLGHGGFAPGMPFQGQPTPYNPQQPLGHGGFAPGLPMQGGQPPASNRHALSILAMRNTGL